jgi:hypothetical protein
MAAPGAEAASLQPDMRCLALVAYAEAVSEGRKGMAAVIRVMHNRVRDPRFPESACAVARQRGQFQAIEESRRYKQALRIPQRMQLAAVLGARTGFERMMLRHASELARDKKLARGGDPTGGALYFVNPEMMDPSRCPWFAKLKRTTTIGQHVFMTHYQKGERRRGPALDCRRAGQGWLAQRQGKVGAPSSEAGPPIPVPMPKIEPGAPLPMPKAGPTPPLPMARPEPPPTVVAMGEARLAR